MGELTVTVHFAASELASILVTLRPVEPTLAIDFVGSEFAFITRVIAECGNTVTGLLVAEPLPLVLGHDPISIFPSIVDLKSIAMTNHLKLLLFFFLRFVKCFILLTCQHGNGSLSWMQINISHLAIIS